MTIEERQLVSKALRILLTHLEDLEGLKECEPIIDYSPGDLVEYKLGGKGRIRKGTIICENDTSDIDEPRYVIRPINRIDTVEITYKQIIHKKYKKKPTKG